MISLPARVLIFIFLFSSMFSIGLHVGFKDVSLFLKRKLLLLKSLLANFIIIPVVGILLATLFPLPPSVSLAIIILAVTPGGLSAIQFISKIKGEATYAGFIVFLVSVLAIFISPWLITLFLPNGIELIIPHQKILLVLTVFLLMPLIVGIVIQHKIPAIANKVAIFFTLAGACAFVGMIILTLGLRKTALAMHNRETIGVMLLFILLAMFIGWLMGGPERKDRQVLAIVSSMRNVALCLAIAMESMPAAKVVTPIVAFGALMIFPNLLFTIFANIWNKKR